MTGTKKKAISVSVDLTVLGHMDEDAKRFGISRSAYISMIVEMMHVGVAAPSLSDVKESDVANVMTKVLLGAGN